MLLRNLVILILILSFLSAILTGGITWLGQTSLIHLEEERNPISSLIQSITLMRNIQFDYIFSHEPRSLYQWEIIIERAKNESDLLSSTDALTELRIQRIKKSLKNLNNLFESYNTNFQKKRLNASSDEGKKYSLSFPLLNQQILNILDEALLIEKDIENRENIIRNQLSWMMVLSFILFPLITIFSILILYKRIDSSLFRIEKGTRIIGSGDLHYRIAISGNDEFSAFSHSFNKMLDNLQNVITSRDHLHVQVERKNQELSKINEDLIQLNKNLVLLEHDRRTAYEELEKKQRELRKSETALKKAHSIAKLGLWEWDVTGSEIFISEGFNNLLGSLNSDLPPTYIDLYEQIQSGYREVFDNCIFNLINAGELFTLDCWITWKDRSNHAIRIQGDCDYDKSGTISLVNLIFQDITNQKLLEEEIMEASYEKETLLREIHHRVKNNMQIITSMLSMQSRMIQEPTVVSLFIETQNRVRSLALVHELLYQSEKLNKIDYYEYLEKITSYLFDSYQYSPDRINCTIKSDNIELPIDIAVPCSLIITELITNSMKYAFSDGRKGQISIDISYNHESNRYILDYQDNGVGFSPDFDTDASQGFGSSLISGLTRQLSGDILIEKLVSGVHYLISFPKKEKHD